MTLDDIFGVLPYGFSSYDAVKDKLIDCRAKSRIPENAKTVISVLFPYYLGEEAYENSNVSRYAVSADYHIITKGYMERAVAALRELYPKNEFEYFVDNSPFPEVSCAVRAGLGALGKNSLFINPDYGSWVFLGEIVTDRYFPPYEGKRELCAGCDRCVKACPAGAILPDGIDREKCLSCLSQKKGELPPEVAEKMKEYNCAWGCDICQKVCPMNVNAKKTPIREFFDTAKPVVTPEDGVEGRAFAWRGKDVIARNLNAMKGSSE